MDFSTIKSLHIPQGEVVKISTPTGILWQKKLPYTELEYLDFDGTYYFNSKYYGNLETKIECKWQRANDEKAMYLYGCASTGNTDSLTAYSSSSGSWRFGNRQALINTLSTDLYTTIQYKTRVYRDNSYWGYSTVSAFTTPHPIAVGGAFTASGTVATSSRFEGKIYYFKIWDDGELVLDWIPVTYEGVNGFWDKVTNTFVPPIA